MTGLEIIKLLWDAGKFAYELATGIQKKKKEEKEKVAELFDHIGKILHETYDKLTQHQYPYGHCRQIEIFAQRIISDFRNELGGQEADKLGNLLSVAHEVERLSADIGSGQVKQQDLYKLEEASGEFIASAMLLRT